MAGGISGAALVIVLSTWARYLSLIPRGRVPARPLGSVILQVLGMTLAVAAILENYWSVDGPAAGVVANSTTAVLMGAFFLWLLAQRKTPVGDLKVGVGDILPGFTATTSDGAIFSTDELDGKRVLLKFFRGGW
ncbi:MAG: hypothetical protein GKS06_12090 [Acidobacteria bacterium]|nr:hypothetical protein [Acidobacteriota bacterium]